MTDTIKHGFLLGIAGIALFAYLFSIQAPAVDASSYAGGVAVVSTSTQITVGVSEAFIIASSTNCAARIISTTASPIMLTFGDQVAAGQTGHLQSASTTVAYDGGIYGCGKMHAIGVISGPITVTETR